MFVEYLSSSFIIIYISTGNDTRWILARKTIRDQNKDLWYFFIHLTADYDDRWPIKTVLKRVTTIIDLCVEQQFRSYKPDLSFVGNMRIHWVELIGLFVYALHYRLVVFYHVSYRTWTFKPGTAAVSGCYIDKFF